MSEGEKKSQKKIILIIATTMVGLGIFFIGALAVLGVNYSNRILPSIYIGTIPIGGASESEVAKLIADVFKKNTAEGIQVSFNDGNGTQKIMVPMSVTIDAPTEAHRIMSYGQNRNVVVRGWHVATRLLGQAETTLSTLSAEPAAVTNVIKTSLSAHEHPAVNAGIKINAVNPLAYTITSSTPGVVFNYDNAGERVVNAWRKLQLAQVELSTQVDQPRVTETDLTGIDSPITSIVNGGSVLLTYFDTHTKQASKWTITKQQIGDWLAVDKDSSDQLEFSLSNSNLTNFITKNILPSVQVEPSDAVFKMNASSTRVIEFVGGRPGVTVDAAKTSDGVQMILNNRASGMVATSTPLIIAKVEPKVRTEDTNNLGIKEILGIGYSNFSGSPRNRILNIRNAVMNKLNGILIPPDAEFSLVQTLKPYTLAGGYLPELVIKGDRITPEIAGGLCQVGTTMFRTTMNSGLPVTARTNHGLVVSYYNDPANGNPGTDATIYDPWPDFRFKNDTGHYVLITTEMNVNNGTLRFTMWGTSDGRKGYYTPPKVLGRTPAGPAKIFETNDLPPGKKECQGAHPGAVAAFNYIRELANGEREVKEFTSVYRAVPATCYVGYDPNKPTCVEGDPNCKGSTAPLEPPAPVESEVTPNQDMPAPVPLSE